MTVIILNANTEVAWASNVVNVLLPTAAECNGAQRLASLMPSDGLSISPKNTKIGTPNLGSKYELERMATVGYDVKLKFNHDTVADIAWSLFPWKTAGFLIVRRGIARATAFATGQGSGGPNGTLAVLPLESGMADEIDPPNNWAFELDYAMWADPADRAIVA